MTDFKQGLSRDHVGLSETHAARRYFRKFVRITEHLQRVAATMEAEGVLSKAEVAITSAYIEKLARTFEALSNKYLLTGRDTGTLFGVLSIDKRESGFPIYSEILTMANDAQQARKHLRGMPSAEELKDQMVRQIVGQLEIPTKLQFAMAQRLYYEELLRGELFWAQNDPEAIWIGDVNGRRRYLLFWAVYDSEVNLPVLYLMEVEDSGATALPKDTRRWPEVQRHLIAQSLGGLKLVTIARGFDGDFDDLHPKRLRRLHLGPMYSNAFTEQKGPIAEVLAEAQAPQGEDWALVWTVEDLESESVTEERKGWFGTVEREVFALDPFGGRGADTGATETRRQIILPQRPYQVLEERQPPGFRDVRKFVVSPKGRVLSYR